MEIGSRIKEKREQMKMSQDELAKRMGYKSRSTIAKIESGENDLTQSKISKIAEILDSTPAEIMGITSSTEKITVSASATLTVTEVLKHIPLLGTIAAGMPIIAEQNIEMQICVPADWHVDYALRVKGNSMIGAGIPSGSIVLCRQQDDVDDGQIAVCIVDGEEATLKRVKRYDNLLVLHPENPDMKDLIFRGKEKSQVKIAGLAKRVIKEIM